MAEDSGRKGPKGTQQFEVNEFNGGGPLPFYTDGSDVLANRKKQIITFYHMNSDHFVAFKAFITAFTETYSSDWASEQVYGRADPIYMFKNTTRKISLTFKVPAATVSEGYQNLSKVQKLVQYLYPNYSGLQPRSWNPGANQGQGGWEETSGQAHANTVSGAPLVRLGFMNLVRKRDTPSQDHFFSDTVVKTVNQQAADTSADGIKGNMIAGFTSQAESGLLGAITNVNVAHNVSGDDGVFEQGGGIILPKMMEVTIDFSPIHEHFLGWFDDGTFGNMAFPYGASQQASSEADYYLPNKASPTDEADSGIGNQNPDADTDLPTSTDNSDEAQEEPSENQTSEQALAMPAAQAGGQEFADVANVVGRQGGSYTWTEGWGDYTMSAQGDISWTTGGGGTAAVGSSEWQTILSTVKVEELLAMEAAELIAGFKDE